MISYFDKPPADGEEGFMADMKRSRANSRAKSDQETEEAFFAALAANTERELRPFVEFGESLMKAREKERASLVQKRNAEIQKAKDEAEAAITAKYAERLDEDPDPHHEAWMELARGSHVFDET